MELQDLLEIYENNVCLDRSACPEDRTEEAKECVRRAIGEIESLRAELSEAVLLMRRKQNEP